MTGVAKAIRTHFCDLSPVNVQLWEANVDDSEKYQLIWQKVIHPVLSDGIETIVSVVFRMAQNEGRLRDFSGTTHNGTIIIIIMYI